MKKILTKFLLFISIISFLGFYGNTYGSSNINILDEKIGRDINDTELSNIFNGKNYFFGRGENTLGERGIKNLILNIARDIKIVLYGLIGIIALIVVIKFIFSKGGDEEFKKVKNWLVYLTIGTIIITTSSFLVGIIFDKNIDVQLSNNFDLFLLKPIINFLSGIIGFVFLVVGIVAFYKMTTANGNDEQVKKAKTSIITAIGGFIVVKFSSILVKNTYDPICGGNNAIKFMGNKVCENLGENTKIIYSILNWVNGFIAIVIVIMTIYAGFLYIISSGEEEKQKKAKNIILYILIGLIVLIANYLILTFFLNGNI
ncbi:MAG: hypothetical protein NWP80_00810 [Candidatus Gracilibacteria bacterium]|nr:hypothetical protein [Candidatus Gracilibacteria bacterium]